MKHIIKRYSQAYLLPATILLGLAIATIAGTFLRFTAMSSQTLNAQNYNAIAEEAARSGIAFADSCLSQGQSWTTDSLKPNTTCTGASSAGSAYVTVNGTEWRSKFSVAPANAQNIVVSTGTVEVVNSSGVKLATYEKKLSMSLTNAFEERDTSTGQSITAIKNDKTDCAIANGKLYCWGGNSNGQLGLGTKTTFWSNQNRSNPSLVGGALSGKTVTKLSVGSHTACVIADGSPYCWGDNNDGALGTGSGTGEILTPTDNVPRTFSGPLQGKKVIDIGTAAQNTPFPIWPFSTAVPHSCALTEDGAMSCWGDNRFRAISGPRKIVLRLFMPMYDFDHNRLAPTLVDGYVSGHTISNSPLAGKKAERIGVSSHDSCALAQGRMYCMGVEVPLPLLCGTFGPGVAFSGDWQTVIPLNGCVANNSAGYDMSSKRHGITGYTLNNKNIDPNSFDVSANLGCMMAQRSFVCVGVGPGMGGGGWGGSFYPPWIEPINGKIYDVDVT